MLALVVTGAAASAGDDMHVEEGRSGALAISILGPTAIIRAGVHVDLQALGGVKPRHELEVLGMTLAARFPVVLPGG